MITSVEPTMYVRDLVTRAQTGDAEAFGEIYGQYRETVFRYVVFRVRSHILAEDLTQETFLRAWRGIARFTWQGRDISAWLVTIARNLVADHYKSGRYRLELSTSGPYDGDLGADRADRSVDVNPEAAALARVTGRKLWAAVLRLGDEQQTCIVLRFLHGFSVTETAREMGKNEGAIKALQYRAIQQLATRLPASEVAA